MNTPPPSSQHSFQHLARAGAVLVGNQVLGMALLLLSFSTIQHTFSKADNGTFFWIQQISGFAFVIITEMGMNSAVIRLFVEYHDYPEQQNRILTTFFYLRLALWFATFGSIMGFTLLTEPAIGSVVALYAMYLGIAARGTLFRSVLETRRRSRNNQIIPALTGLLDVSLMCGCILFDRANLTPFRAVVWFTVAALPGFLIMLYVDNQWKLLGKSFDTTLAKRLLRESMPIFLSLCLMQIQDKSDTIAINLLYGREMLGVYSVVMRVIIPSTALLMIIALVITPPITRLLSTNIERCKIFIVEGLKISLLMAVLSAVMLGAFAKEILLLTSGAQYTRFTTEMIVGAWTLLTSITVAYILAVLVALGKQPKALPMMFALCVLAVVGNMIFTPVFGVVGAMMARIFATSAAAVFGLFQLQRFLANAALASLLLRCGIIVGIMGLALWGSLELTSLVHVGATMVEKSLLAFLRGGTLIGVFLAACLATGVLHKNDIALLRNLVSSSENGTT